MFSTPSPHLAAAATAAALGKEEGERRNGVTQQPNCFLFQK
jgi:hypothetical protein